ncbi:MAG: hypothetical protein ACI97N_000906 [Cognaticolwellia sp.]|jgi:hypothetical protein
MFIYLGLLKINKKKPQCFDNIEASNRDLFD